MTDQELIKQWDEYLESMGSVMGAVEHMAQQMRDRIELLVTERDELGRKLNTARYGQPDFAWSIHVEAMADLRVKLAKAVDALRFYAYGHSTPPTWYHAHTVLSEIEGDVK